LEISTINQFTGVHAVFFSKDVNKPQASARYGVIFQVHGPRGIFGRHNPSQHAGFALAAGEPPTSSHS